MKRILPCISFALASLFACSASAYNHREHQRLPDQAYQIMNILRRGDHLAHKVSELTGTSVAPLSDRPSGVSASEQPRWEQFLSEAKLAPGLLGQIRTGLADARQLTQLCKRAYPDVGPGELALCKASEIGFAVKRGWATNTSDCFVRDKYFFGDSDAPEFFEELPSDYTGALLGYYGQQPDDEIRDTVMWLRPSNVGFISEVKAVSQDATGIGLTVLFAPVICLFDLFSGGDCWDDAMSVSNDVNPVSVTDELAGELESLVTSALPWPTDIDGDDYFSTTGLWHFINVEAGEGEGIFNSIGGMHYLAGGWRGSPDIAVTGPIDSLDYAIILSSDGLGLTLDPDEAQGVERYQQSPDGSLSRRKADWLLPIGHTEFEPLDNLALYGWRRFQTDQDMSGLGWVLHALGDAVEPQHEIAATGWGHRPFEDYAGFAWRELFSESGANHYFKIQTILEHAYEWWKFIDDRQNAGNPTDIPVRELITALAFEARAASDFAYRPGISIEYGDSSSEELARQYYGDNADETRHLLELGTGATMAFLIKAAPLAVPPSTPSPCACPPGEALAVPSNDPELDRSVCQSCSSVPLKDPVTGEDITTAEMVEVDGHCAWTCPADNPFLDEDGHCTGSCPQGGCSGVVCPNPTDFVENDDCVPTCSPANPVLVGRECWPECPPFMIATTSTSPPFCVADPNCLTLTGTRDGEGVCADVCPSGEEFIFERECRADCPAEAPFFVSTPPLSQCLAACPAGLPFSLEGAAGNECFAQCPVSDPFNVDGACVAQCPPSAQYHLTSGTCVTVCPGDRLPDGDGLCVLDCPLDTIPSGDQCILVPPPPPGE